MVPPGTLVTPIVIIWTTLIPSTFLTLPIFFVRAFFVFRATFIFCCKCKFRGDFNIPTGSLMVFIWSGVSFKLFVLLFCFLICRSEKRPVLTTTCFYWVSLCSLVRHPSSSTSCSSTSFFAFKIFLEFPFFCFYFPLFLCFIMFPGMIQLFFIEPSVVITSQPTSFCYYSKNVLHLFLSCWN